MKFDEQQKKVAMLAGGAVFFLILWLVLRAPAKTASEELLFTTQETTTTSTTNSHDQATVDWFVDLKGSVVSPGMYRIKEGMRLMDAIELAGGFSEEADRNQVNLAKLLSDQEIIYVPKVGEEIPIIQETGQGTIATDKSEDTEKININTADSSQLQQLSGIGVKRAQDIINYREENGSFQSIEDLMNVSGIGQKTLENLRNSITI
ncbi:helix-hairpin-helix domain-containing protein [Enterococcus sp. AZ109]|uniref:helix-hairpin-helix domain-containing protein n=1 Tax=Enterococcus sp. AZ109 TaxID=2774634 RepID=UPI003F2911B9